MNHLEEFLKSSSLILKQQYDQIQTWVKQDPASAGDQGEENWAELLRKWLPSNFHVVTKGRILHESGDISPQVDIIVLSPNYPPYLLNQKLYLLGGVLAIFECKLTFKIGHLSKFFSTSIGLKKEFIDKLEFDIDVTLYDSLQTPFVFGLLAHSSDLKGKTREIKIEKISKELIKIEKKNDELVHPILLPDIICIADLEMFNSVKAITIHGYSSRLQTYSGFVNNGQDESNIFGSLVCLLYYKIAYQLPSLAPIAKFFIESDVKLTDIQASKCWDDSIFRPMVLQKIYNHKSLLGRKALFDKWSSIIL